MGGRVEEVSHGWKAKSRGAEYQEKSQLERLNESGEYLHIPETLDRSKTNDLRLYLKKLETEERSGRKEIMKSRNQ